MAAWAGLGYYSRARNLHACAKAVVAQHGGRFPDTEEGLRALPGIGAYTAGAIAAIAFDRPAAAVDGNVERVMTRLFAIEAVMPAAKPLVRERVLALLPPQRPGDFAQGLMDLGATICTPRNPACGICPWMPGCAARALGIAATLPRKTPKPEKPTRAGTVWLARREDGALLLERRPDRGLLGGTLGFPGDAWDGAAGLAPLASDWQAAGEVRHTFTHFHLILSVQTAQVPQNATATRGEFLGRNLFSPQDLPTLMRKAHDLAFG